MNEERSPFKTLEELEARFAEISNFPEGVIWLENRYDAGQPITADVLNTFVLSRGFQSIDYSWIEISRKGALYYLGKCLRWEQVEWKDYASPKDKPEVIAERFIEYFAPDARFFTHGLCEVLEEFPLIEKERGSYVANFYRPFPEPRKSQGIYNSWAMLNPDPLKPVDGLVAVDSNSIGYILIPNRAA